MLRNKSYKACAPPFRDATNLPKKANSKPKTSRSQKLKLHRNSPQNVKPPQGDLDDASLIIPSPPKNIPHKGRSPTSKDTNETSHEQSGTKKGVLENSDDFLDCDENLGPTLENTMMPPKEERQSDVMEPEGENLNNPLGPETLNYLIARERTYFPDAYYLEKMQPHLTWMMRAILFDWMMEVCAEFHLKRETFHFATNYVDRYLSSVKSVPKTELQLVGVSAMFIASKMEEIYCPKIADFAKATDDAYTEIQIREMETILSKVFFRYKYENRL